MPAKLQLLAAHSCAANAHTENTTLISTCIAINCPQVCWRIRTYWASQETTVCIRLVADHRKQVNALHTVVLDQVQDFSGPEGLRS